MDQRSIKPAFCLRCGYDLRGTVAEWTDACPIAGRCNECGLEFAWIDIFHADQRGPRWCVEFARRRALPLAIARTWGRSLLPPRLFGPLKLSHEIRPWRLALYVVSLFLIGYAVLGGLQGLHAHDVWRTSAGLTGWRMNVSAPRYVLHAVVLPLSRNSVGTMTAPPGGLSSVRVFPTPAPRESMRWWSPPVRLFMISALILGAVPFTFLLLPISVRRAKVRPRHLGRITVYSTGWLLVLFLVFVAGLLPPRFKLLGWGLLDFVGPFAVPVALFLTWHSAIRHYLRMSQPTAVAAATISIAVLAVVLFLAVFRPTLLFGDFIGL